MHGMEQFGYAASMLIMLSVGFIVAMIGWGIKNEEDLPIHGTILEVIGATCVIVYVAIICFC